MVRDLSEGQRRTGGSSKLESPFHKLLRVVIKGHLVLGKRKGKGAVGCGLLDDKGVGSSLAVGVGGDGYLLCLPLIVEGDKAQPCPFAGRTPEVAVDNG